jgi:hypothetical protein
MGAIRTGWLRLGEVLVAQGLISERDAMRVGARKESSSIVLDQASVHSHVESPTGRSTTVVDHQHTNAVAAGPRRGVPFSGRRPAGRLTADAPSAGVHTRGPVARSRHVRQDPATLSTRVEALDANLSTLSTKLEAIGSGLSTLLAILETVDAAQERVTVALEHMRTRLAAGSALPAARPTLVGPPATGDCGSSQRGQPTVATGTAATTNQPDGSALAAARDQRLS